MKYYLSGVAGAGMNALAQYLISEGHQVYGSDRSFDRGQDKDYEMFLSEKGIVIAAQDGRILDHTFDACIFSAAVEDRVPDFQRAASLKLPCITRSKFLKTIYNNKQSIGVAGTSGKTTVTGMLATILKENGRSISVLCGAEILNYSINGMGGNCLYTNAPHFLSEVDESDKAIDEYRSHLALITNISEDHMPLPEALTLFKHFIKNAESIVFNDDCDNTKRLAASYSGAKTSFSLRNPMAGILIENIKLGRDNCTFTIRSIPFRINMPGLYNIENAAAAVSAATTQGISLEACAKALSCFTGIKGRFEQIRQNIYYDFAHNPAKLNSLLTTATALFPSIVLFYQPHGYTPFKSQFSALNSLFKEHLRPDDVLLIGKIFDAGGSVSRDISSSELVRSLENESFSCLYIENRSEIDNIVQERTRNDESACFIVGARDRSLRRFAIQLSGQQNHG